MLAKNRAYRKGITILRQIPRYLKLATTNREDCYTHPPVLCQSFAKSGTHLLLQIVGGFPGVVHYGTFLTDRPSLTFKFLPPDKIRTRLGRLAPSEMVGAHLPYDESFEEILIDRNVVHFFIYRDPRDVVISEAYYLTMMNPWHRLHRYFKALPDMDARILLAIEGIREPDCPYYYPDISKRFAPHGAWIQRENVFPVRFEELVTDRRENTVQRMLDFYLAHTQKTYQTLEKEVFVRRALEAINPNKSHTFREGKVGGWRNKFSQKHCDIFKQVAGQLLVELDYEVNLNW